MKERHKIGIKILLWITGFMFSDIEDNEFKKELKRISTHVSVNLDLVKEQ